MERPAAPKNVPAPAPRRPGFLASLFRCRACEARDQEIAYLRRLVDVLLESKGLPAVQGAPATVEDTEEEKLMQEREKRGALTYGEA